MPESSDVEFVLRQAVEREKEYDWLGSVELLRTALSKISGQDILKTGEIHEQIGYGLFRAACQADSVEEFKKRMQRSIESYEKAADLLEKVAPATGLCCRAMVRYSDSCFIENPSKKMELLDDRWRVLKDVLEGFDATRNHLGCGKAFNGLAWCLCLSHREEG